MVGWDVLDLVSSIINVIIDRDDRSIKLRSLLEKTKKHTKTRRFEHQKLKNIKREREKLRPELVQHLSKNSLPQATYG